MAEKLDAHDPRYQQALNDHEAEFGFAVQDVLLPTQWAVVLANGEPVLVVNEDGMRALALMSPRPDAQQFTEGLIARIMTAFGRPS